MSIIRKNNSTVNPVHTVFTYKDGVTTPITKVIKHNTDTATTKEVFPPSPRKLEITSSIDQYPKQVQIPESMYSVPEINQQVTDTISITIKPTPANSGWYITSASGYNLDGNDGVVYYGEQTLQFPTNVLAQLGTETHDITVHPRVAGTAKPVTIWFSQEESAEIVTNATYLAKWRFNNTLADDVAGKVLQNQTYIDYPSDVPESVFVEGYNTGDAAIRTDYSPNLATSNASAPYFEFFTDMSADLGTDWYQRGYSLSIAAVLRDNGRFGFYNGTDNTNRSIIQWSYTQPMYNFGTLGNWTDPPTTTGDRIPANELGEWVYSHLAVTVEPILDIYNHPEFTVDADGLGTPVSVGSAINIVWQDPTKASATFTQNKNINDVKKYSGGTYTDQELNATNWSVMLYRFYINGILHGGAFDLIPQELLQSGAANVPGFTEPGIPGGGRLELHTSNDPNSATQRTQYIDYMAVSEGAMLIEDIQSEALNYGIQPGAVDTSVTAKVTDARYRFPPADKTIGGPDVALNPVLKVFALDNETIMVGSSPNAFYQERIENEFPYLADSDFNQHFFPSYANAFHWEYNVYDLIRDYQRQITAFWNDTSNITMVDSADGVTPVTFTGIGRWNNPNGDMRLRKFVNDPELVLNTTKICPQSELQEFTILKLDTPLSEGDSIDINIAGGYSITYTHDHNIPSRAIKVNQVGYPNEANTPKLAFIGQWMGIPMTQAEHDALPAHPELPDEKFNPYYADQATGWNGSFEIRSAVDQSTVYTGTAQLRNTSDLVESSGWLAFDVMKTGEIVWELDFTDISVADGEYQVYVPSMGYSWKFTLGNQAAAKAMYTYTRGLTYLRSGYAFDTPNFPVTMPAAKTESFESKYPGDWDSFGDETEMTLGGLSYRDINGSYNGFGIMGANATGKRERNVTGGYHDAADYDRRHLHMRIPRMFCETFLEDPSKWTENQFDLNESGNGIPDILNEALYGLEVWYQTQLVDGEHAGAIRPHIETDKHESGLDLADDPTWKYYIAQPSARDSLNYAASAALLARCLYMIDTKIARREAEKFTNSAIRAWNYGVNNLYAGTCEDPNGNIFQYNERADKRDQFIYTTACSMYVLTKDKTYLSYMTDHYFDLWWDGIYRSGASQVGYGANYRMNTWDLLMELADVVPAHHDKFVRSLEYTADYWIDQIETDNYYFAWWAQNDAEYIQFTGRPGYDASWNFENASSGGSFYGGYNDYGATHPENRLMPMVHMWAYSRDEKYRNAIIKSMNYWQGANPNGISKTMGLGHCYPSIMLDDHIQGLEDQGYYHGRRGVTPYGGFNVGGYFSSGSTAMGSQGWGAKEKSNAAYNFTAIDQASLPGYLYDLGTSAVATSGFLAHQMPQHRYQCWNLTRWKVASGEFTVWETMAGKCQVQGAILKNGESWTPDPSWALEGQGDTKWDVDGHFPPF